MQPEVDRHRYHVVVTKGAAEKALEISRTFKPGVNDESHALEVSFLIGLNVGKEQAIEVLKTIVETCDEIGEWLLCDRERWVFDGDWWKSTTEHFGLCAWLQHLYCVEFNFSLEPIETKPGRIANGVLLSFLVYEPWTQARF